LEIFPNFAVWQHKIFSRKFFVMLVSQGAIKKGGRDSNFAFTVTISRAHQTILRTELRNSLCGDM
jgi:hypothetical protein